MPTLWPILLAFLSAGAAACAAFWLIVTWHVLRTRRKLPTARDALDLPEARALLAAAATPGGTALPRIRVIIPAHNEEAVVGILAASFARTTYPNVQFVFSLDRCTDATEAAIRAATPPDHLASGRVVIRPVTTRALGWAGKVNAVHEALVALRDRDTPDTAPDLLVFADADTVFDPQLLFAAAGLMHARELDLLSLLSTLTVTQWFESIAQGPAAIELLRQCPPLRANESQRGHPRGRPFANGQFLMFRRDTYERIGGHESVKSELLEDIHLARRIVWTGHKAGLFVADGMLCCRMYADWSSFQKGWKRIFIEAADRKPGRLRKCAAVALLTGVLLPLSATTAIAAGALALRLDTAGPDSLHPLPLVALFTGILGTLAALLGISAAYRLARTPWWCVLLYPVGAALIARLLARAAADLTNGKAVEWKGMHYQRQRDATPVASSGLANTKAPLGNREGP